MLNQDHFTKFITEFYGYGEWSCKHWFIGIEEGGHEKLNEIQEKLELFYSWQNIDGLVDNLNFQTSLSFIKSSRILDSKSPKAQATWLHPLKALLNKTKGQWPTLDEAKKSQIDNLGRQNCSNPINSLWIELLPLPNPGVQNEKYSNRWPDWTNHFNNGWKLPLNRIEYESFKFPDNQLPLIEYRIDHIIGKMIENKPLNVINYFGFNKKYRELFMNRLLNKVKSTQISNISVAKINKQFDFLDVIWDSNRHTRILFTLHPSRTNHGQYWMAISSSFL